MTTLEALEALQRLFADPAHWTFGFEARTATGEPTYPASESATCWCFTGGVSKITGHTYYDDENDRLFCLTQESAYRLFRDGPVSINDSNPGREGILSVIADAIAAERANAPNP